MEIYLRLATDDDIGTILAWRQEPGVYEGLYTQSRDHAALLYNEHIKWWYSHQNWKRFIIVTHGDFVGAYKGEKYYRNVTEVGWLYINLMDGYWSPEIGLGITTTMQNKGIGKQALSLGLDWLCKHGYKYTHTTILDNNEKSIKLFTSLGYVRGPESRPGESWYFKNLSVNIPNTQKTNLTGLDTAEIEGIQ